MGIYGPSLQPKLDAIEAAQEGFGLGLKKAIDRQAAPSPEELMTLAFKVGTACSDLQDSAIQLVQTTLARA